MTLRGMSTMVSAAALVMVLGGCGTQEPTTQEPTAGAGSSPQETSKAPPESSQETTAAQTTAAETTATETIDAETTEAETTQAETTDAETTETAPGGDAGGQLPTSPTAYSDAFIEAWAGGDPAQMAQFASPDALASLAPMTPWNGAAWRQVGSEPADSGAMSGTLVHYSTDDNQLLTFSLDNAIVDEGGQGAIAVATYSLGDYPVPSTVEDYASAFLSAVGTGDDEFAVRLGPLDGFAGAENWSGLTSGMFEVSDFGGGEALVTVPFQEGGELEITIDRAVAEASGEHAITSVVFHE